MVASIVSVLLGLVYLSVSLTRPASFIWGPDSPMTESAVPFAAQLVLSLLAPVAFALGLDQVCLCFSFLPSVCLCRLDQVGWQCFSFLPSVCVGWTR